jgi:chromosome partitioning protein
MGKRVLMVDLDPQAHLTACLDQERLHKDKSLYSVMVRGGNIADIITPTSLPTLKLIPSSISLAALEVPLFRMHLREFLLRRALAVTQIIQHSHTISAPDQLIHEVRTDKTGSTGHKDFLSL